LRVLVMDDDPMIVAALTHDLSDRGCQTRGATSIAEAEDVLGQGFGADAMVVDFDLGCDETGLDFLGRIERTLHKKVPGLILTGGTDAATLAAIATGGVRWLTKPADPDVIAGAIAGIISRPVIELDVQRTEPPALQNRASPGAER
jgi:DNA-binding response OmpR family regulator